MLAGRSKALLDAYRLGMAIDPSACPLQRALGPALRRAPDGPTRM
jgi:hypothetical protein